MTAAELRNELIQAVAEAFRQYYSTERHAMNDGKFAVLNQYFSGIRATVPKWFGKTERDYSRAAWIDQPSRNQNTLHKLVTRIENLIQDCRQQAKGKSKFANLLESTLYRIISPHSLLKLIDAQEGTLLKNARAPHSIRASTTVEPSPKADSAEDNQADAEIISIPSTPQGITMAAPFMMMSPNGGFNPCYAYPQQASEFRRTLSGGSNSFVVMMPVTDYEGEEYRSRANSRGSVGSGGARRMDAPQMFMLPPDYAGYPR